MLINGVYFTSLVDSLYLELQTLLQVLQNVVYICKYAEMENYDQRNLYLYRSLSVCLLITVNILKV